MVDRRLTETERKLCEEVLEWKALSLRDVVWMRPAQKERSVYGLIERLCAKGMLIKRRILRTEGRERNAQYVVLSTRGLELFVGNNASARGHEPLRPETAERILLSNKFVFNLVKAGLPLERVIFRRDMLRILGLPSRLTAVDWGIKAPEGLYTVHLRDRYNSRLIWRMIREVRWIDGVLGHIVVCKDAAAAARCRRAYYRFPKKRPAARRLLIVSLASHDDFRLLAEKVLDPDAWLRRIVERLNETDYLRALGVMGGRAWDLDVFERRVWIGRKTSWLAADLRLWEMIAFMQAYYGWSPSLYTGERHAEKVVMLVKSYRDAKLCAQLAAWDPDLVWVVENAPAGKAVFCSRDGCFMAADSSLLGIAAG